MKNKKEDRRIYWFVFISGCVLLKKEEDGYSVPLQEEAPAPIQAWTYVQQLPELNGHECRAFSVNTPPEAVRKGELESVGLRASYQYLPKSFYDMAGKGAELLYWDSNTKFCGVCGAPMKPATVISKKCTHCGKEIWPQVSPAIIVRIRRNDTPDIPENEKILLVHARNFRSDYYGLVAGFVETGETLEQCVEREVWEETHLKVTNIRYFGSQPWPYPCGIMIGFTADYVSGEVKIQQEELSKSGWFGRKEMPAIPGKMSIARKLIDDWLEHA
ncbi:MAG: NAD(+) diphosphatase [Bacteroidaceae bacterium]|nr:NAD(+) diphosphatase [Bacteroidaceae bacterium]